VSGLLLLLACAGGAGDAPADKPGRDTDSGSIVDSGTEPTAPLELCINEWMPKNDAALVDEGGLTPDWIELHNPGSAAVDLAGWSLTDDGDKPGLGPLQGTLDPGGFALFHADGSELPFALSGDGGEVGLFAPDGRGSVVRYGAVASDFSVARVPDCCSGDACFDFDFRGTPGATNVDQVFVEQELVPLGGTWRYWDGGSVADGWAAPDFDDSAWPSGAAPLGYGDAQATVVSYGDNTYAKHITTWFRARVDIPATELTGAAVQLVRDDGAVVWWDGVELVRSNLPEGALTSDTVATYAVSGAEETQVFRLEIDPTLLTPGSHVLAVEVHQASADSSDLNFDAGLVGTAPVLTAE